MHNRIPKLYIALAVLFLASTVSTAGARYADSYENEGSLGLAQSPDYGFDETAFAELLVTPKAKASPKPRKKKAAPKSA